MRGRSRRGLPSGAITLLIVCLTVTLITLVHAEQPMQQRSRSGNQPSGPSTSLHDRGTAWPGPSNTGVPKGILLHDCDPRISESGDYDRCQFAGSVVVAADDVTIMRSLIVGRVLAGSGEQQVGLSISDTTIDATQYGSGSVSTPALSFRNFVCRRCNIFGSSHGVQIAGDAVLEDSWIHDICCDGPAHKDGVISNGGRNVIIRHNQIECAVKGCSAALGLFGDFAPIENWRVEGNLFNTTGGYCTYAGGSPRKRYPATARMVWRDNWYGDKFHTSCGAYGPTTAWFPAATNLWIGNRFASGAAVAVKMFQAGTR